MTPDEGLSGPTGQTDRSGHLEVIAARDDARWMSALAASRQHDFHHLAAYHRVAEERGEGTGLLFVHRESGYLVALPLLIRQIEGEDLRDATSVYGYGGPVMSHDAVPPSVVRGFQDALRGELAQRRVVAVFSRLHPLVTGQRAVLSGLGRVDVVGPTISIDLTVSPEAQWMGYRKKCRRIIERARDAGVVCVHDRDRTYRHEWAALYDATMRRVGASSSYRYDEAYFELLADELGSMLHQFVALVDGRVAAAGLFTVCDGIVQAHLGATDDAYLRLSPTRLVDDTARRWAAASGARVFHLGGGVGGREDSLFQYKAGFSDRRHEFAVWKWVVEPEVYRELCRRRHDQVAAISPGHPQADYFPAYRRPPEAVEPGA